MYTMRKTPRSSFMSMGDATATITPTITPTYQPVVVMTPPVQLVSPPFVAPTAATVPVPDPTATVSSPNYGIYMLAGGAALVAYWMLFGKEG